ncbi:ComEC/Rec2 family competence protein [Martelella mediterranea]|nr:ComEC/Rec2 family competence protein [Martelella mediterranea]
MLRHKGRVAFMIAGILAMMLTGAFLTQVETLRRGTVMLDSAVTTHVTGYVESREKTDSGWRYVVSVQQTHDPTIRRPPERVTLVARGNKSPAPIGAGVSGLARLSPPSAPALPGLVDFGLLSYFDGIGAVGFFYGAPDILETNAPAGQRPEIGLLRRGELAVERLRDAIATRIRAVLSGETGAFANAIITGQRRGLSDGTLAALRNAGLAHVIAISGLHMALAAGIFFAALRFLMAMSAGLSEGFATKKVAAATALSTAFLYLLISGMQVSAQRAFLMLAIMLVAAMLNRPAISLRNVAVAAFIILSFSPSEAAGPGMQMSFAATLALIAGYGVWQSRQSRSEQPLTARMRGARLIVAAIGGVALTSLIGGLATAPFAMDHFHRMAGYGLLGNLLAMPIVTFIVMPAGLAAMLLMPLNLHTPFLAIMGEGLQQVLKVAFWVDSLGGAIDTGQMPEWFLPLFIMGFMPLVLLKTRLRLLGMFPIAASLWLLLSQSAATTNPRLLISEEGGLVAILKAEDAFVSEKRPAAFIYDQWISALTIRQTIAPKVMRAPDPEVAPIRTDQRFKPLEPDQVSQAEDMLAKTISASKEEPGRFYCQKDNLWCVATLPADHMTIVQMNIPALTGKACDQANIIISRYRPGFQKCRSGAFLVTPAMRRQTGTLVLEPEHSTGLLRTATRADDLTGEHETGGKQPSGCATITLTPSLQTLRRPWNRHRLYDWRKQRFEKPIMLPKKICV